ncbi:hypothetical protein LINPERPRIM_LOCUS36309 [Linum perenne]
MEKASIKLSCSLIVFLVIANGVMTTMGGEEGEIDRVVLEGGIDRVVLPTCKGCPSPPCKCYWNHICICDKDIRPALGI